MQLFQFICPGCKLDFMYKDIHSHVQGCQAAKDAKKDGALAAPSSIQDQIKANQARKNTVAAQFMQPATGQQMNVD